MKLMKRYFLLLACTFFFAAAFSQRINNLVVFSNEGEPFTLIMNGERYNETPQTRVRVTGLTLKEYQVRLIFKNPKLKDHDTKLTFFSTGWECEFALNPHGRKRHTMDFFTQKRMEGFDQPQNTSSSNTIQNTGSDNTNISQNNTGSGGSYTVVPTETVSSAPVNTVMTGPGMTPVNQPGNPVYVNTNDGSINVNMGNEQYQLYKNDIIKQVGDVAREAKALAMLKNNLLTTVQVKDAMSLLSSEKTKLAFAKRAYHHTRDRENYNLIVDAFPDQASKDDLEKFIQSYK